MHSISRERYADQDDLVHFMTTRDLRHFQILLGNLVIFGNGLN